MRSDIRASLRAAGVLRWGSNLRSRLFQAVSAIGALIMRLLRLAKEGFWVACGQAAGVTGALAGVGLLTGILSPQEYGSLALGLTISGLLNQLTFGPLTNACARFYSDAAEKDDRRKFARATRELFTGLCVIILIVYVAIFKFLPGNWDVLAILAILFAITTGKNSVSSAIQTAARNRKVVALHQALDPWLRTTGALMIIHWFGPTGSNALLGYVMGASLTLISQSYFMRDTISDRMPKVAGTTTNWHDIMKTYATPFVTWGIFSWAQVAADRWALDKFQSREAVGLYTALYQVGFYPISLMTAAVVQLITPILYQRAGDGTDGTRLAAATRLGVKITIVAIAMTCGAGIVAHIWSEEIMAIIVGPEYQAVSHFLPGMVIAGGLFAAGQSIALTLMARLDPARMTTAKICSAVVGTAGCILGAKYFSVLGIVIAQVGFSIIYLLWMAFLLNGIRGLKSGNYHVSC